MIAVIAAVLFAPLTLHGAQERASLSRADLARYYLRFDEAYRRQPPPAERLREVQQQFDSATLAFFSGDTRRVVAGLVDGIVGLVATPETAEDVRWSLNLLVRPEPMRWVRGQSEPKLSIAAAGLADATRAAKSARLELVDGRGTIVDRIEWTIEAGTDAFTREWSWSRADLFPDGLYRLRLQVGAAEPEWAGQWVVTGESFDLTRERLQARLDRLDGDVAEWKDAWSICRARIELLSDEPSLGRSAEFLIDPVQLVRELESEVALLEQGADPYRGKRGDTWRIVPGTSGQPVRLYVPASLAGPAPLVIAFHGAGGDENMFVDGYGHGLLRDLADLHGFVVASPLTGIASSNPRFFDRLVASVAGDVEIDPTRIFVLGHSMGTGPTLALAVRRADSIAAVCALAGGTSVGGSTHAPVLVVRGGIDPLMRSRGPLPARDGVEVRDFPDHGHTLVVTDALPQVIDWLLARRLNADTTDEL